MEMNYNNFNNGIGGGMISPDLTSDKQSCDVSVSMSNKKVNVDVGGEFTFADHLPEIRKLIKVDVKPLPPSKFISGSSVQLSGGIEYTAFYLGSDGEIYGASFPGEYSFSLPFDGTVASANEVAANVYPESAVSRVSGARRINIRCRLASDVNVQGVKSIDLCMSASCEDHVQKLIKKMVYSNRIIGSKDDVELMDEVDMSDDGVRYISSECHVYVEGAESGDGYVDCRGYATVKHLMCREGGELYTSVNKIPFSETVEMNKLVAGSPVCVSGTCADINIDVQGDDAVDEKLKLLIRICLDASAFNQSSAEYVKDIYSTRKQCVSENETHRLPVLLACKNGNMTFSGYSELSDMGISADRVNIVDVSSSAVCESIAFDSGKYEMSGKCRFGVTYYTADTLDISYAESELPFKYVFDGNEGDVLQHGCVLKAIDTRARCDGEKMQFDCELWISCFVLGESVIEVVSSARMEGEASSAKRGFTVCYPSKEDSLWDVAKRYRSKVKETAKENGMDCLEDPDEVKLPEGIKYMIV